MSEFTQRIASIESLAETNPQARVEAFASAREAVGDSEREIRTAAAGAIAATADPFDALEWLGKLARDSDVGVRYAAVAAAAGTFWRGRFDFLARALDDDDLGVAAVAADGLSHAGDRRALPVLHDLLDHRQMRFGALEGLFALRDEQAIPLARKLYGGLLVQPFDRAIAALMLARIGDADALKFVRRLAEKRMSAERGLILSRLADADSTEGLVILERVATSDRDDQRETALLTLTRVDPNRWWPAAVKSLHDAAESDAQGAAEILLSLADIDSHRAMPAANSFVTREDALGVAARRARLAAALRDAFPGQVLVRADPTV